MREGDERRTGGRGLSGGGLGGSSGSGLRGHVKGSSERVVGKGGWLESEKVESRGSDVVGRQDSLTLGSHLLQAAPRPNAIDGLAEFEPTLWELQHLDCGFEDVDEMGRCVAM